MDKLLGKVKPENYRDVPDHALLYLVVEPDEVWVGEGVRARLYLSIHPADQEVLEFSPDFAAQIAAIRRLVKPADVWEELPATYPTLPDTIPGPDGQYRLRFLLHDAVYYPLTTNLAAAFSGSQAAADQVQSGQTTR